MLVKNEADIAPGPLVVTSQRVSVADPTVPYSYEEMMILAGRPKQFSSNLFSLAFTFSPVVWLMIVVSLIVCGLSHYVIERVLKTNFKMARGPGYFIWLFLSSLLSEAVSRWGKPSPVSQRLVTCFWLLGAILVTTFFTAFMKASLLVKQDMERIWDIEDLSREEKIRPVLLRGSGFYQAMKYTRVEAFQKVYRRAVDQRGVLGASELFSLATLRAIQAERAAMIFTRVAVNRRLHQFCAQLEGEFYYARQPVTQVPMAMFVRKGLPRALRRTLDDKLNQMRQGGLLDKWLDEISAPGCEAVVDSAGSADSADAEGDGASAGVTHFLATFLLLGLGLACSIVALFLEQLVHFHAQRKIRAATLLRKKRKGLCNTVNK
ncbi:glutamate receptor-like [Haemaphysalis longicornis]